MGNPINCIGWQPIITSKEDQLSKATLRRIASHNLYGERLKCWKKPK